MTNYEKLKHCLEQERSLALVKSHLARLEERLAERRKDLVLVEKIMKEEYLDIVTLEAFGMQKLFHKVLGNVEQQLEIERQEYLMVVLKHKDVVKSLELMEFEKKVLLEKLDTMVEIKDNLNRLIGIREEELIAHDEKSRARIKAFNQKIDQKIAEKREIYEAKIVAAKVKHKTAMIIKHLNDANAYDEWNGDPKKHAKRKNSVDAAQGAFYELKQLLEQLEDELYDIYKHRNIRFLNLIEDDEVLAKNYHSNLITDWVIHKKINNSILIMQSLHDRIERLSSSLVHEENEVEKSIDLYENRKEQFILGTLDATD